MIRNILLGFILLSYPFFIQAKSCFTINDISVRLDDKSTSDGDFSKFENSIIMIKYYFSMKLLK